MGRNEGSLGVRAASCSVLFQENQTKTIRFLQNKNLSDFAFSGEVLHFSPFWNKNWQTFLESQRKSQQNRNSKFQPALALIKNEVRPGLLILHSHCKDDDCVMCKGFDFRWRRYKVIIIKVIMRYAYINKLGNKEEQSAYPQKNLLHSDRFISLQNVFMRHQLFIKD